MAHVAGRTAARARGGLPELERRGPALRLIATMAEANLTPCRDGARPAAHEDPSAMRWFVPALAMHPLSMQQCCVRNPLNDVALVLPAGECAVLAECAGCRTLEEHAAGAMLALDAPSAHRPAITACLERCAQLGLLVALPDLVARCGTADGSPLPPLGAVAIRTADRPAMLERLLASAAALQARSGTVYPWHVIDDSRRAENRRANREALARQGALGVTYHDLSIVTLEDELKAAFPGVGHEIGWLLGAARGDEATYGRPLNYALLRFAGRRLLLVDDDATLQARRSPTNGSAFAVARPEDELRWYANFDAACLDCPALDVDPLAEHTKWLGLPLAQAWPQLLRDAEQLGLTELSPECAGRFRPEARIRFTHNHALGDPGWSGFPQKELTLPVASRRWLSEHPEAIPFAFDTAFNWRGVPGLHLSPEGFLSTTTVGGIDNTLMLPPTARATRGEDVLLGRIADMVCPWTWSVDLPFALPHLRATPRRRLTPRDLGTPEPIQFLIQYARRRCATFAADTVDERMAMLAACYIELGAASDGVLRELLTQQMTGWVSWLVFNLNLQLEDPILPVAWKQALGEWVHSPHLRLDAASVRASAPAIAIARTMARDYGRALNAWPQLWSCCRERFA